MFRSISIVTLAIALLNGCAAFELSAEEKAMRERAQYVTVSQNNLSLTELQQYQELGPVKCEEHITSYTDADEECRDDLKLSTARLGGNLVVLEYRDRYKCSYSEDQCLSVKGRAYVKRTAAQMGQ